jgi:hypothetical protein
MDKQFAHDGGKSDFGWFALTTEVVVKLSQGGLFLSGEHDGAHIKGVAHDGSAAADMTLAFPRPALAGPRSQASQGRGLLAVKLSQFGHVAQHGDGGDKADALHLIQDFDLFLVSCGTGHQLGQLFFDRFDLSLQMFSEFGLLFKDEEVGGVFALLAGAHPLLPELSAPIDQSPHLQQGGIGFGCGRRFMCLAKSGEQGTVERIAFGAEALRQSEMTDVTGIEDGDGPVGGLESGDDWAFVAAGSFADDLNLRTRLQQVQQFFMACRRVGQGILTVLEVELKGGLGNIQAGIDGGGVFGHSRKSCSAHSCTYERAVFAAAQSTVRVTDNRHERLRLPREHVQTVQEGNEHARAAARRPAGRRAAPSSCLACSQTRKMKRNTQEGRGEVVLRVQGDYEFGFLSGNLFWQSL